MTLQRLKNNFLQHSVALTKITTLSRRASLAFVFALVLGALQIFGSVTLFAQGTWTPDSPAGHVFQTQVYSGAGNRTLTKPLAITYTWTSNDGTPAPQSVVLKKVKGGSASGMYGGMMCTNIVTPDPTPVYEVRAVTGNAVTVTESVTTTATTPSAGGRLAVTLNVQLAYPKITLLGTTKITGTGGMPSTENILIGQGCSGTLSLIGSIPEATLDTTTYNWTVSGATGTTPEIFDNYEVNTTNASTGKVVTCTDYDAVLVNGVPRGDRFKKPDPRRWIWRVPNAAGTVEVNAKVIVPTLVAPIGTVTDKKTVKIEKPEDKVEGAFSVITVKNATYGGVTGLWLRAADQRVSPIIEGMVSKGYVSTPSQYFVTSNGVTDKGLWHLLQLWTVGRKYTYPDGVTIPHPLDGQKGLDTTYPYSALGNNPYYNPLTSSYVADTTPRERGDSPGETLTVGIKSQAYNEPFETYAMYLPPDKGQGRDWVAVHRITWKWEVTLTSSNAHWQSYIVTTPMGATLPIPVTSISDVAWTTHPEWDKRVYAQ
jgi:hypothetical protein